MVQPAHQRPSSLNVNDTGSNRFAGDKIVDTRRRLSSDTRANRCAGRNDAARGRSLAAISLMHGDPAGREGVAAASH